MARHYVRDARGRFASKGVGGIGGYQGQTSGRGARLKTPGNVRDGGGAKQKLNAKAAGTIGKPKGLKPQDSGKLRKGVAYNRLAGVNAKMGDRPDMAQVNIKGRFSGQAGKRYDAGLDRVVKAQKAADRADSKARNRQFKSDQSRAKALRTAHVGAIAKAKGLSKGQVESALKAQPPSVQIKALKNWVRDNRGANAKPAASRGRTIGHSEAYARRSEAQLRRGIETGRRAQAYLSSQNAYAAPIGSRLSNAWGKAGRVEWGSRNALNSIANKRLNEARKKRTGGFS